MFDNYIFYKEDQKTQISIFSELSDLQLIKYYSNQDNIIKPLGGQIFYVDKILEIIFIVNTELGLINRRSWQFSTDCQYIKTANNISNGKINTELGIKLSNLLPFKEIFSCIQKYNVENLNSIGDWYIGNSAELNLLKESNLVNWFEDNFIWSSENCSSTEAVYWDCNYQKWLVMDKLEQMSICLIRDLR